MQPPRAKTKARTARPDKGPSPAKRQKKTRRRPKEIDGSGEKVIPLFCGQIQLQQEIKRKTTADQNKMSAR